MPVQRRTKWLAAGAAGAAALGAMLAYVAWSPSSPRNPVGATAGVPAPGSPEIGSSGLPAIAERLRRGDLAALGELQARLIVKPGESQARKPLEEGEAAEWVEALTSLRTGFLKFGAPARGTSGLLSTTILDKFAVEPCPATWIEALKPTREILSACLNDGEAIVRVIGLTEVEKVWAWLPGRSLAPDEERALWDWKEKMHLPVVRCLAARDSSTRISAVACLGKLPIDAAAAPAAAYIEDRDSVDVRKQTLISFSQRPALLTEDMLLKRIHDDDISIRETAISILKARGLTSEQITLGSLIFHPRPEQRLSVIPQIKDRTDIDPVVWLLELSRDPVEVVRIGAIGALAGQKTRTVPVNRRLAEMAKSDRSEEVRRAAGRVIPTADETTASLPPLPGSSALNPRAN